MKRVWWTVGMAIVGSCFGWFCSRVAVLLLERCTMCTNYGRILGVRSL